MLDRSRNRLRDPNKLAKRVVDIAVGESQDSTTVEGKNPAAVALGRLGGKKGGVARAKKLSAAQRKEIAANAANVRWPARPGGQGDGE